MEYINYIFDLDGTLLDTLPDIKDALNKAFEINGFKTTFSLENVRSFIGDGPVELIKRAIKNSGVLPVLFEKIYESYKPLYKEYQQKTTKAFEGIKEALDSLSKNGKKLYVVTNKPHPLAIEILTKVFGPNRFEKVLGFQEGKPRKPSKEYASYMLDTLNINPNESLYIGDSLIDAEFARNANLDCCLVKWGYGNLTEKDEKVTKYFILSPNDLINKI